jgi:hypothetical protein
MGFSRFTDMPSARPVSGYGFRTYRPGDEEAWLGTLATGEFGIWDRARLDRMLAGERAPLPLEGVVFATSNDVPVGVANLSSTNGRAAPIRSWAGSWCDRNTGAAA